MTNAAAPSAHRSLRPRAIVRLAVACLLVTCGVVHAGAREDVEASMQKFLAASSWHATMQIDGKQSMTNELDFTAPDRYRINISGMGTQYIIGDSMTISMQGHTMKVPMPKGTLNQYRDPAKLRENNKTKTFEALGNDIVDGKPARKYRIHDTKQPDQDTVMWIGGGDYPIKIKVDTKGKSASTATIRYSRFNDPTIRVQAP